MSESPTEDQLTAEERENLKNWLWQKKHHAIADSSMIIGPGSGLLVGALRKLAERELAVPAESENEKS